MKKCRRIVRIMRARSTLLLLTLLVALATLRPFAQPQTAPTLVSGTITHLGVAVRDIDTTARKYADLFGIPTPDVRTVMLDLPNGSKAELKVANVAMPDFRIELDQPVTSAGPVYEHLQKYCLSVHHLGISIEGSVDEMRTELVRKGGKWTAGSPGGTFAYVDFRERLGTTIEIVKQTAPPGATPAAAAPTGLLGGRRVSHIGLAVKDINETMNAYVEILGVKPVPVNKYPPSGSMPFPPGHKWDPNASVLTNMLRFGRIGIELIQSVGSPTPWTETWDKQHGLAIQHVAVGRGPLSREEWLRTGQEKGRKWTNGGPPPEGTFAYMDFSESLGLIFE